MSRIHEGLETKDFVQPDGITNTTVCSKSGLVPLEGTCANDPRGSMLTTEYFDTDTVPTDSCDHHVALESCADSGAIAGPYCPNKTSKVFIIGAVSGSPESVSYTHLLSGHETKYFCISRCCCSDLECLSIDC